jgi:hypothetical protein
MEIVNIILLLIQMGTAPTFPEGKAMIQDKLADKIIVTCSTVDGELGKKYTDTLHVIKNHSKFKSTKKSYFSTESMFGYIFLTQIDSTYLFAEDPDYSMLNFLRLKTNKNNLAFTINDSLDNIVNHEALREIKFNEGINVKMYEDNNTYTTKFLKYTEYWQCNEKMDYAPKYPYIQPEKTLLRKNLSKSQAKSAYDVLTSPIFVFSVIPVDDNADWADNLSAKSVKQTLVTDKGREIEGRSIDLNNDNVPDAFWYVEIVDSKVAEWYVRLYVNYMGEWVPMWYNYFREL